MKNKYYIVLSAYNEGSHIVDVLKNIKNYSGINIVVIDDGSKDDTSKLAARIAGVWVIKHKINLGKGAAMKTGAEFAFENGANAVIFMDSDSQHSAEDLPKFLQALEKERCDVVFGSRNLNFGLPLVRYIGNKFASVLVNLLFGIYVSDLLCGFRAITKKAYGKIKWESSGYGVETEMVIRVAKAKLKYCEVPVETIYRDRVKGVTIMDAFGILLNVLEWRLRL